MNDSRSEPPRPLLEAFVLADLGETDDLGIFTYETRLHARLYCDVISFHRSEHDPEPVLVYPSAMVTAVDPPDPGDPLLVTVSSAYEEYSVRFESPDEARAWRSVFGSAIHTAGSFRFGSFAPPRPAPDVRFFIDGSSYYGALADAIDGATHSLLIADWWLSPEVYLRRDALPLRDQDRLDNLLAAAAGRGVGVYILLYSETGVELGSQRAAERLGSLSPNIHVLRHAPSLETFLSPTNREILFSHHQKFVVVDQTVAFVGGLALCFGRYDTLQHPLLDPGDGQGRCFFPGCDYYHPSVAELDDDALADPFSDPFDRAVQCRMPWHDVHCRVAGEAARDVAISFVQRWNHHHWSDDEVPRPLPLIPRVGGPGAAPAGRAATAQVLRSLASWNGGAFHETSIYNAWLDAIERSERFIYIEQQFFISSLAGEPVVNRVAEALLTRLSRAIRERARFRVVVVLPVHPEGNFREQSKVWALLGWQYRTISRGGQSLLERLRDEFPGVDLDDYVAFFSLRGHAVTPDRCVTSQIYVHSKLVIVDDRLAIIGSANINDRSLLGVRDSEIALRIETPAGMGANPVRDFRVALWNHHLGLPEHSQACADPTSELVYRDLWLATADSNTELYQRVFPDLPHSRFTTLAELEEAGPGPIEPGRLAGVRGTLVRHPLGFLANEDLTTSPWDVEFVLGDDLLT